PHLDQLATESVEFTQFCVCPNCSPTRASLLTGRYNYRTGVTEVARGRHLMYASEVTIAEILRKAGYRTGIFGKWHLGDNYPMRPTDQGFEEALVHKGGGIGQAAGPPGNTYFDPVLEHNNVSKKFNGYCDDIFSEAAIEFIETNRDRPFFAYLATNLPHLPLEVPDARADPYRKMGLHEHNARVYGMITNIDANVGRVLAKLKQLDIEKKTIVIFLSDNGPRTRRTKNDVYPDRYVAGLRGTKTSVYENGIRVPFFIRWPGKMPAGRKVGIMAGHIDILPTVLEVCQIAKPDSTKLDGHSLIPVIHGESVHWSQRNLYFQWHSGPVPFQYVHFAARSQRYKLLQPQDDPHAIITHPSRDELQQMLATLELYDIQNDPSELNNIAGKHPEIVKRLLTNYEHWFSDVTGDRDFHNPQRIIIGSRFQNPVVLSRFEWRGPRADTQLGSWDEQLGHWEVQVAETGRYQITLRFAKAQLDGTAHVRFAGVHEQMPVKRGDTTCVFDSVRLAEGPGRFESFLKLNRLATGVHFVDVNRRD
ncbi:MAG: arylsulfatase, partial [Pirellulaceae bacterium]|nr:arylsulfatase [Pirellulaceae bacterium]